MALVHQQNLWTIDAVYYGERFPALTQTDGSLFSTIYNMYDMVHCAQ